MKDFIELRIKIKSLAAEAKIIRQQEAKIGRFIDKNRERVQADKADPDKVDKVDPVKAQQWEDAHRLQRKSLSEHRRGVVANETRHALLAYGFLRGLPLSRIERSTKPVQWKKVQDMIVRFGEVVDAAAKLAEWRNAVAACAA